MKSLIFAALAAALAMPAAARAQDAETASAPSLSANLGVASDYIFRGLSQTNYNPQISAGADAVWGKVYAGAWASNVEFGDGTDAEVDLYVGITPTLGPVELDLSALYYVYVGAPSGSGYDMPEFIAKASLPVGAGAIGAAVAWSPDSFGPADNSLYIEANASAGITEKLSLSGAIGRQSYSDGAAPDYTTWNVGFTYQVTDILGVDLRYHDTNRHELGKAYGSSFVVGLTASF